MCTPLPTSIIPSLPHLFSPSSSFSCTLLSLSSKYSFHLILSPLVHPSLYFTSHHYFWYSLFLLPSPLQCWFSRLPPVMILELSRFEFDQTSKRVEKINDQLTFEQVLYTWTVSYMCMCICSYDSMYAHVPWVSQHLTSVL